MNELLKEALVIADKSMRQSQECTIKALSKIRTGRATPEILDGISVMYYGNPTPLQQVASVSTPDAHTLIIKPWEKTLLTEIERGIFTSRLDLTPRNNGETLILSLPPLTEERRLSLMKRVRELIESGKVSVRNVRKDTKDRMKKLKKDYSISEDTLETYEEELQKYTDKFIQELDGFMAKKESEVMKI